MMQLTGQHSAYSYQLLLYCNLFSSTMLKSSIILQRWWQLSVTVSMVNWFRRQLLWVTFYPRSQPAWSSWCCIISRNDFHFNLHCNISLLTNELMAWFGKMRSKSDLMGARFGCVLPGMFTPIFTFNFPFILPILSKWEGIHDLVGCLAMAMWIVINLWPLPSKRCNTVYAMQTKQQATFTCVYEHVYLCSH